MASRSLTTIPLLTGMPDAGGGLDPRADAAGEHEHVGREDLAGLQHDAFDAVRRRGRPRPPCRSARRRRSARPPCRSNRPPVSSTWSFISVVGRVDHGDVQAQVAQRLGRLQPEQAAAEDDGAGRRPGVGADAAGSRPPSGRRTPRPSAGRRPPAARRAAARTPGCRWRTRPRRTGRRWPSEAWSVVAGGVEPVDQHAGVERDAPLGVPRRRLQRDLVRRAAAEDAAEQDAVVAAVRLLAEDVDARSAAWRCGGAARRAAGRRPCRCR